VRLRELIGEIGAKYDRQLPMSSEAQMLLRQAGVEVERWIPAGYQVEGIAGKGRATATPRIVISNPDETTTTRRGMHVAYLFAVDMSTVALTLGQGIIEVAEQVGRATARRAFELEAAAVRASLDADDIADLDTTVDLRSTAALSIDRERATILARTYALDALPDESTMVADLRRFIRLYALALDAREKGRQQGNREILLPAGRRAAGKAEAPEPEGDGPGFKVDAEPATLVGERRDGALISRRGLLAALAVLPAAFAGGTVLAGEQRSHSFVTKDVAPRFTIDVSHHDWRRRGGNLDWAAVRDAGIVGMCARATYGDPFGYRYASHYFGDFARAARAAGLAIRGGYHNLVRGDQASINRQVDWLRQELDAHDANWAMLDVERYAELVASDMWPRWDDVRRFDDRWAAVEERVLAGYIPPWLWNRYLGRPDLRAFRGPLIASNYPLSETSDEYRQLYERCGGNSGRGWASYGNRVSDGWQFSSRAKVPGASFICGVNAWRLTAYQLAALLTGAD
jgi:hypothetical protein